MNTKHILLVEDDPRDADLTLAALGEYDLGDRVFVVHNGEEALDYLYCQGKYKTREGGHPMVVLLDNKMPKIGGLEVLKTLKSDEYLKTIPVVALTSSREMPDLMAFYEHGINAYVVKPMHFGDFMRVVKHLAIFWVDINEPPPSIWREAAPWPISENISPEKLGAKNAIPSPHLALER